MLSDLHIRNLAVVAEASMALRPGFNVLSGETGAGKSIVVDALALLCGSRASVDLIRSGAESLTVTGVFEPAGDGWRRLLEEAGIEVGGGELVIRREISRQGRSRAFVNDQAVTVKLLGRLSPALIRIHGQREELGLTTPDLQRAWLDRAGGEEATALSLATAEAYRGYREAAGRLERVSGDDRVRSERIDLLRFQLSEIDAASVEPGEERGLREERQVLRHAEAIREALAATCELLFDGDGAAYDALARSRHLLVEVSAWERQAGSWTAELDELRIRVGELESALRRRLEEVAADPQRLNAVEERLSVLERLLRKHGGSSEALLERRQQLAAELAELEGAAESCEALESSLAEWLAAYREAAGELAAARGRWARGLAERVERELGELALDKARFEVSLGRRPLADSPLEIAGERIDFGADGWDRVVYLFSPNPGEELRPLAKIASGGELSRLYLAVQLASGGAGESTTLVFDEVDSGVGGAEAAVLGSKLRGLAAGGQILAVTHLPQVVSHGDAHFKVSKTVEGGRTHTRVERLEEGSRVEEVARMLAGSEITELSLSHARELLAAAHG